MSEQPVESKYLGPGSVLKDVVLDIVVDNTLRTSLSKSFTLPTGRIVTQSSGLPMYTAILDTTKVQLPDGRTFDATPSITIIDTPDVGQDILISVAYGSRNFDVGRRTNFKTEVTIRVGDQTFQQTHSVSTGCMDGSTLIALPDGSRVPISEIVRREVVLNPITGAALEVTQPIRGPEPFPMHHIGIGDEAVLFSSEHPIPVRSGLKVARDIVLGDLVMDAQGRFRPITVHKVIPPKPDQVVYNLQFKEPSQRWQDHVILAGHMVVGDYWLQEQLRQQVLLTEERDGLLSQPLPLAEVYAS